MTRSLKELFKVSKKKMASPIKPSEPLKNILLETQEPNKNLPLDYDLITDYSR